MRPKSVLVATTMLVVGFALPITVHSQSIGDRLKKRVEEKIDQKVDRKIDQAADKATCVLDDLDCMKAASASGKKVAVTDKSGKSVSSADSAKAVSKATATTAPTNAAGTTTAASSNAPTPTGEKAPLGKGVWLNYDFIPGDRTIWFEDFSGDDIGDFPRRMKLVEGNSEVVKIGDQKFLRTAEGVSVVVVLPEKLPTQFTIEVDYASSAGGNPLHFRTRESGSYADWWCYVQSGGVSSGEGASSHMAAPTGEKDLVHCRFTISDRYVRAYINETRVANVPTTLVARTDTLFINLPGASQEQPSLITNLRVAAGGRKLYDALAANGRVTTQGILFDTGRDIIRPESTPTLKEIGEMLTSHADLKIMIEGHTDNVGQAAANQSLSEKRAAAVRQYLMTTYSIPATRLQSAGFGATKPASPNTTAEGRQNNRRVELVKIP